MELILKDLKFKIRSAAITATLPDPYWCDKFNEGKGKNLLWSVAVEAEKKTIDGETWAPQVYHEAIPWKLKDWKALDGSTFKWATDRTGSAGFYVFEHGNVSASELKLGKRTGASFDLSWKGTCGVHWDETYGSKVPFKLTACATFKELVVHASGKDSLDSIRERVSKILSIESLKPGRLITKGKYNGGVAMATCIFKPQA